MYISECELSPEPSLNLPPPFKLLPYSTALSYLLLLAIMDKRAGEVRLILGLRKLFQLLQEMFNKKQKMLRKNQAVVITCFT
jgi:hypothetical protein